MKLARPLYVIFTLPISVLIVFIYSYLHVKANGPHANCYYDPDVGPCDRIGSTIHLTGFYYFGGIGFAIWSTLLFLGLLVSKIRYGFKDIREDIALLLVLAIPLLLFIWLIIYVLVKDYPV